VTQTDRVERLQSRNLFDELLALRDQQRQDQKDALALVDGDQLPWELNRQGYMKWYMHPLLTDISINTFMMYLQRIPARSRSGRQLSQGHQMGFVWNGSKGHTIVDEVRYDWDHWDLIQIPLKVAGVVVQHFNDSDEDIDIMFCSLNTAHSALVDRGAGFEQLEDCPEYRAQKKAKS
jgi:gentisate 1,2-dioxygenase